MAFAAMSNNSHLLRGARAISRYSQFHQLNSTLVWPGIATVATAATQPSTSGQTSFIPSTKLNAASVGAYFALNPTRLPEASQAYVNAFYVPREPGRERRGGCKALQKEVAATGTHAIMYRPVMHTLFSAVGSGSHQRLLLTGAAGTGKSIALVSLVEWARQNGWLVLYVPSCLELLRGGFFHARPDTGRWDTPTSAQQLLKGMLDAHGPQLQRLPLLDKQQLQEAEVASGAPKEVESATGTATGRDAGAGKSEAAAAGAAEAAGSQRGRKEKAKDAAGLAGEEEAGAGAAKGVRVGEAEQQRRAEGTAEDGAAQRPVGVSGGYSLHDLVVRAVSSDDNPHLPVDTVLQLVRQLAAASRAANPPCRVLFALDDYNFLYGATEYGTHVPAAEPHTGKVRRVLQAHELTLAHALRLLDAPQLGSAAVVAATTTSTHVTLPSTLPISLPYTELPIPGFSEAEIRNALSHYHATKHARALATSREARQLHALTQGNARELRISASTLGVRV